MEDKKNLVTDSTIQNGKKVEKKTAEYYNGKYNELLNEGLEED